MLRSALALTAFLAPVVAIGLIEGCGSEPLPQDLCSWLADDNNCHARFADDVGTQCGYDFVPGNDPVQAATGFFQSRDDLSLCILNQGGQVLFNGLDLTMFPVKSVDVTMLDFKAQECGAISVADEGTFTITINPVDADDAGASGPLDDDITGGTFSIENQPGRNRLDVSCPGGFEQHNFNTLLLSKCPQDPNDLTDYLPVATIESSPGAPESTVSSAIPGYVRLYIEFPPDDPGVEGATERVVEYFNCLIPAPPAPCEDGIQNNDETDVDCGGSCPANCAEGQSCNDNDDCLSGNCGFNEGIKQCLPAA